MSLIALARLSLSFVIVLKKADAELNDDHLRELSDCLAPPDGCGYGIWNEDHCECNCVPDYCFNEMFKACITVGSCPNPFEGCTPGVNCPYFANPMSGQCQSGSTITPGVFTIFWSAEECCMVNYPDRPSCIPSLPPSTRPSGAPVIETAGETIIEETAAEQTNSGTKEPQGTNASTPMVNDTVGVFLAPIPVSLHNLPDQFELNKERRESMKKIFHNAIVAVSDEYNLTILSLDIVDGSDTFSDPGQSLPFEVQIEVTGVSVYPGITHEAFQEAMQDQVYDIADSLGEMWGPEMYTDSAIIDIGDVQTKSYPSPKPINPTDIVPAHGDEGKKTVPIWAMVLVSILFILCCGGLLVWQRRRDENMQKPPPTIQMSRRSSRGPHMSNQSNSSHPKSHRSGSYHGSRRPSFDEESTSSSKISKLTGDLTQIYGMSDEKMASGQTAAQSFSQSRRSQMSEPSYHSRQSRISYREREVDQYSVTSMISGQSQMSCLTTQDTGQNSTIGHSRSRMSHHTEHTTGQNIGMDPSGDDMTVPPEPGRVNNGVLRAPSHNQNDPREDVQSRLNAEDEAEVEEGYDGEKSSFFVGPGDALDDSSDEADDDDSADEGNVLGLLYYDGATSADESEARESGKSRRSKRTHRSGRTRSSASKQSSGKSKSSKSRRSKPPRSRRKKAEPLNRLAEESEFQSHQQIDPGGLHGNLSRPFRHPNTYVTTVKGDDLSGSVVYTNDSGQHGALDEKDGFCLAKHSNPRAEQSAFSHGSTIRTEDIHHKAYARDGGAMQDGHGLSFNSGGEVTTDLCNEPEVKTF